MKLRHLLEAPNLLTLSRLPLAGLVWLDPGRPGWVLALLAAAALSDGLDGWLARRLRSPDDAERRRIGSWLDPLCDKTFVLSALVAVWSVRALPWWVLPLIATRELLQTPLILAYHLVPALRASHGYDFRATLLGKATTVAQFLAVTAMLLGRREALPLAAVACAIGAAAALGYLVRAVRLVRDLTPRAPATGPS